MATELSISDLGDILADLHEISTPYQLGIHLDIDPSTLRAIEKNHPRDIDRQKTEVIEYWLRNSPSASWTTLAEAMERLGEYKNLVRKLREKEQNSKNPPPRSYSRQRSFYTAKVSMNAPGTPPSICLETCVDCDVLILGKMGHGKSTIGNRILNSDGWFRINSQECPQTCKGSATLFSVSQSKNYKINVYDHDGLFEGTSSVNTLSSDIRVDLDLVIFVLKRGHSFDVKEWEILSTIISELKISRISALVITHCERLSEEEREKMIDQFKEDHPSVAELMGKGILAVGFPDNSHVQPGSQLSQSVEDDKAKLRRLIYSCDYKISHHSQNEGKCCFCCSIL